MEVLGLLSGIGHLPVDVAKSAKAMGYKVIAIGVQFNPFAERSPIFMQMPSISISTLSPLTIVVISSSWIKLNPSGITSSSSR